MLSTTAVPAAPLGDREALAALLTAAAGRDPRALVSVAWRSGERVTTAALGGECARAWAPPLGCIAKVVTAMLACRVVAERRCDFATPIAELLGGAGASLRGVTLRHLLEHTHGLDDSLLARPCYSAWLIDAEELLERVQRLRRSWPAGALYSYGNLGAWLVAAALERLAGRPYGVLVREWLMPLAPDAARAVRSPVCAATGSGLALTAEEIVRVVSEPMPPGAGAWPDDEACGAQVTPLPGWNPLERGVYLGFKHGGGGWFGHQSTRRQASIFVRFAPRRGQALAVLSRAEPAAIVAARLLGAHLPELFDLRAPWREPAPVALPDARCCGRFEQAACVIEIAARGAGLQAVTMRRDAAGAARTTTSAVLDRAAAGVWLARPASELLPYAQLLASDAAGLVLWNGRCALPKV